MKEKNYRICVYKVKVNEKFYTISFASDKSLRINNLCRIWHRNTENEVTPHYHF